MRCASKATLLVTASHHRRGVARVHARLRDMRGSHVSPRAGLDKRHTARLDWGASGVEHEQLLAVRLNRGNFRGSAPGRA